MDVGYTRKDEYLHCLKRLFNLNLNVGTDSRSSSRWHAPCGMGGLTVQ